MQTHIPDALVRESARLEARKHRNRPPSHTGIINLQTPTNLWGLSYVDFGHPYFGGAVDDPVTPVQLELLIREARRSEARSALRTIGHAPEHRTS